MNIDEVRQVIDGANRKFSAAAASKDYAGMAALYTEDAKVLPPDAPIVSGRKAIEEFWRTAANALGLKLSSGQAKVKYLLVWLRSREGQWHAHRDIWNNMPTG